MAHIPLRFATRSTDPKSYSTACVTAITNVFDQPNGKVIARVDKGCAVTVLKSSNGWSQILIYLFEAEPNVGWVQSSVLTTDTSGLNEGQLNTDVTPLTGPPPDGVSCAITERKGTAILLHKTIDGWADCGFPTVVGANGWIPIGDIDLVGPSVSADVPNYS
jgi:hypothetical protein